MPGIRITARGFVPSAALLLTIILVPQLLAGTLSDDRARTIVSDIHRHRAISSIIERYQGAPVSEYSRIENELAEASKVSIKSLRVRRSVVVPPFARRTAFIIEAHLAGASEPEYYRVRGARTYRVSPIWWHLRL